MAVSTDDMLIIGAGAFEGLPADPSPSDLVQYGYSVEFAGRISQILSLEPLTATQMTAIYRRAVDEALIAARDFGYEIVVSDGVLLYVANAVADSGQDVTPRAGMGWLQSGIDKAVLTLLDLGARSGTTFQLQPDDVPIPRVIRRR